MYATFIDYEKAFDTVNRKMLWQKLRNSNINGKILNVIRDIYEKTKASVRVNGTLSDYFDCHVGVR